ncbi:MAG TPA: ABC transporter substrate-binding protein [Chloroflexota bacterium]|nr:ABC transporter substrate-binding protein [Chloroflexota bacterium]
MLMRYRGPLGRLVATLAIAVPLLGTGVARAQHPAAGPTQGGMLTVAFSNVATNLDPAQASYPPDNSITTGALFSGLYRINVAGKLVPDISAGLPQVSNGQRVFTVQLKHGVYFNAIGFKAREVTAQDVKYTYERVLDPHLKPSVSWGQASDTAIAGATAYINGKATHVSGIQALGRYTVRFTLAQPLASFPYVMAISANFLVPVEAVAQYGQDFGAHPVGTGPFMVKQWVKTQQLVLVRNPLYFVKGLPYLDGLTFQFNVDKNLEILRWQNNQIDAIGDAYDLPPNQTAGLAANASTAKYVQPFQPSGTSNVLYINNLIPPFNNTLVRKAVAYAIDKRRLLVRYRGQAIASTQIYPPAVMQHTKGFQDYPYDPAMARQLLKQAGYSGAPIEVLVDEGASNDPLEAPSVEQDLRAVGFTVKERGVSDQQANTIEGTLKGYTIIFGYWGMDYPDAYDFVVPTYTPEGISAGGLNFSRYSNPRIDTLVAQAEALPFGPARDAVYARIQRILVDDVAAVPLFYRERFNLGGPHVGSLGWTPAYSYNEWAYAWRR